MTSLKGFKVTDAERKSRVGIAVRNLDELKRKTLEKFKLNCTTKEIYFQTQDGTVIETNEYFQTLPAQTLLIWVRQGEQAPTDAEILYKTIREVNDEYLSAGEKVQEFFTEKMKQKVYKLAEVLKGIDAEKGRYSKKNEHPEWFEGLDTNAKTKEEYMFKRAQDRIRTYFYKTKEELTKQTDLPQDQLKFLLNTLQDKLKLCKYFGCYFDRTEANEKCDKFLISLCTSNGDFHCQGRWDKDFCLYTTAHLINPYKSREERIIFSTWNLDHTKERSRSVIPAICKAVCSAENFRLIDAKNIFNDLFTLNNLKFVHIVCHDKGVHATKQAGPYLL